MQSVQGRIAARKAWWFNNLQLSALVFGVLLNCYMIPFIALPPPCFLTNNRSALNNAEFVVKAINELLLNRCVIEVFSRPYCCNPLSVVVGRKLRLVLDLGRSVNPFVKNFKFKYEGLPTLAVMFRENFWFFTFDIESGYHHLDINSNFWKFLGFSWSFDGVVRYFVFRVLPFGLSSACYLFTKMFKPFVARWRSFGIFAVVYVDDEIFACRSLLDAQSASKLVRSDLQLSGWKSNEKKSNWEPRQLGEWLGIIVDTIRMLFIIPEKKNVKLKSVLTGLIDEFPYLRVRDVARVSGFVISLSVALGPIARLFTRQMYFFIQLRHSWDDVLVATEGVLHELKFWLMHVEAFNGYPINRPLSSSVVLTCDASESGYGAHISFGGERMFCSGMWSSVERALSSSLRELLAVYLALKSFQNFIIGKKVKIFSDNQNVVRIVHAGSSIIHLQQIAVDIFSFCMTNSVSFQAQWIPRGDNEPADYLSRIVDPDDWMLHPDLFKLITFKWGPFDVDRMACSYNTHLL